MVKGTNSTVVVCGARDAGKTYTLGRPFHTHPFERDGWDEAKQKWVAGSLVKSDEAGLIERTGRDLMVRIEPHDCELRERAPPPDVIGTSDHAHAPPLRCADVADMPLGRCLDGTVIPHRAPSKGAICKALRGHVMFRHLP